MIRSITLLVLILISLAKVPLMIPMRRQNFMNVRSCRMQRLLFKNKVIQHSSTCLFMNNAYTISLALSNEFSSNLMLSLYNPLIIVN